MLVTIGMERVKNWMISERFWNRGNQIKSLKYNGPHEGVFLVYDDYKWTLSKRKVSNAIYPIASPRKTEQIDNKNIR